ncbi:MAG: two-component regulator propeller domain-containing protein [Pyrinomonadaceae bacterium]
MQSISGSIALIIILFLVSVICARAEPKIETMRANEYLVKQWTTEHGLPQNTVTSIIQTKDGYLWLGTFGGLARFDGVRFTIFDAINTPVMRSGRIVSLFEDASARLWIGTETGDIYYREDGEFRVFSYGESLRGPVWGIIADDDVIYFSSDRGLERFSLGEDGVPKTDSGVLVSGEPNFGLFKHPDGSVWTRIEGIVYRVDRDRLVHQSDRYPELGNEVFKIGFTENGDMAVGEPDVLRVCSTKECRDLTKLDESRHGGGFAIATRGGSILLQQVDELLEYNGSSMRRYDLSGIVRSGSRTMLYDSEGNLWLATQADGLVKLTPRRIGLLSDIKGEELENIYTLLEGPDKSIWIGGRELFRVQNNSVTTYSKRKGGPFPIVRTLAFDGSGGLWVGGTTGLYVLRDEVLEPVPGFEQEGLHAITFDSNGDLWIGGVNGLWKYTPASGKSVHFTQADLLPSNSVHRIFESRDGSIWIGTIGGLSRISGDRSVIFTSKDGLSGDYVREIVEDVDGAMWFGTYGGGLTRLKDGRFSTVARDNGLPNNYIARVIVDANGRFWILSNFGVFVVSRDQLNRVADGHASVLSGANYGPSDGVPSSEANGGHQYAGILASDGRLWFPMLRDVPIIDPARFAATPPKVLIERAYTLTGTERVDLIEHGLLPESGITVEDGVRNLEVEFTGLNFTKPEAIRFHYKLEGLEDAWHDAGQRRTVFYPYLPAGSYTLIVTATSASGMSSEAPATLRITVEKRFWETTLFQALVALLFAGLLVGIVWIWIRRVEQGRAREREFTIQLINSNEAERTRIAKELHDSLGQHLLLIKNWSSMARSRVNDTPSTQRFLERISETASASLDETRAIVQDLGPQTLRRFGLTEAIEYAADHVQDATGIILERKLEKIDGLLPPDKELSIYRIVQECLNNVIKHSESPRAKIEIARKGYAVLIQIEDYGKGIEAGKLPGPEGQSSGFGFHAIFGRVHLMGGKVTVDSVPGQGTKVGIELPINR